MHYVVVLTVMMVLGLTAAHGQECTLAINVAEQVSETTDLIETNSAVTTLNFRTISESRKLYHVVSAKVDRCPTTVSLSYKKEDDSVEVTAAQALHLAETYGNQCVYRSPFYRLNLEDGAELYTLRGAASNIRLICPSAAFAK